MKTKNSESESKCGNSLALLREKVKDEEFLQNYKDFLTDDFLLHFIQGRKYRVEYALETIKQYFYVRQVKYPDFFLGITPSKLKIKQVLMKPMKQLGPEGQTLVYSKREWWPELKAVKTEGLTADHGLQKFMVLFEDLWKRPGVDLNGFELILDLTNLAFSDVVFIAHISYAIKVLNLFHKAFPLRARKIHLINPPSYVNIIVNLCRPIDPARYLQRVFSHHGDLESFHKHFSPDILPKSLNGFLSDEEAFDDTFHERAVSVENDADFIKLHQHLKLLR